MTTNNSYDTVLNMKQYKSIAEWGKNSIVRYSEDFHDTEEQANAVCRMLERDGFGGMGVIFPVRTMVEKVKHKE